MRFSVYALRVLCLCTLLLVAINCQGAQGVTSGGPQPARILYIASYHPAFPTFSQQLEGIRAAFVHRQITLDVEFMDRKRFSEKQHLGMFHKLLAYKMQRTQPYDVIIVADDDALQYVMDYGPEVFGKTPVVFCGINNQLLGESAQSRGNMTGVLESISVGATYSVMKQFFPELRRIWLVADALPPGQADLNTAHATRPPGVDVELRDLLLTHLSWEDLAKALRELGEGDAVLLLSAYVDRTGRRVSFQQGLSQIVEACNVPVFHLWEHGLGQGIMGGKLVSHREQGLRAGQIADRILDGALPAGIDVVPGHDANRFIFDHRELTRFGVSAAVVPPDSEVLFGPGSAWGASPREVGIASAAVALQFVVILLLARQYRRRKHSEKTLLMLTEATAPVVGYAFFEALVAQLSRGLRVRSALVGVLEQEGRALRTLALWTEGAITPERVLRLDSPPLNDLVAEGGLVRHARPVACLLPQGHPYGDLGTASCLMLVLKNAHGLAAGVMAVFSDSSLSSHDHVQALFGLLGVRAEAELQRMHAEAALRESESRYRSLFEENHAVIMLVDPATGAICAANRAACAYYGWPLAKLLTMSITEINTLPPDEVRQEINRATMMQRQTFRFRHRLADGRVRDVEVYTGPMEQGGKTMLYSIVHDVTERLQVEATLRQREETLQSIFRAAPTGIGVLMDTMLVEANHRLCVMTGYTREELVGLDIRELYADDEAYAAYRAEVRQQQQVQGTATVETSWRRKDRGVIHVLLSSSPFDTADPTRGIAITALDITQRKQTAEALGESEQRNRMLTDNAADAIYLFDTLGGIVDANPEAERQTGYTRHELLAMRVQDLDVALLASGVGALQARLKESGTVTMEGRHRRKDGSVFPVESRLALLDSGGKPLLLCLARDVTTRKRTEDLLHKAKEAAEAASRAKSEFLANMSHEVRTPLNGIMGMLQLMDRGQMGPEDAEYLDVALGAGQRLTNLLGDILDLSRVEAGRMPLVQEPFDLRELLHDMTQLFTPAALQAGLGFEVGLDASVPVLLQGDSLRLRQVLFNLVGNGIKFTEKGGVTVRVTSSPQDAAGSYMLHFAVSDTGVGIPEDQQLRIFDPFTQVDGSSTRRHQGAGLGLTIARKLAEGMGGTITLQSKPGAGTAFTASIPFAAAEGASPAPRTGMVTACPVVTLRVLVAEDDRVNQMTTERLLQRAGCKVTVAANGVEALEALLHDTYDLVLMDIQMPVMDGMEATERLRSDPAYATHAAVPVVALTAHVMAGDRERFLACGMDDFLGKPVSVDALMGVLERVVAGSWKPHAAMNGNAVGHDGDADAGVTSGEAASNVGAAAPGR